MTTFTGALDKGLSDEFKRLMSITNIEQADDLDAIHPEFWPGRVKMIIDGDEVELMANTCAEKERGQ